MTVPFVCFVGAGFAGGGGAAGSVGATCRSGFLRPRCSDGSIGDCGGVGSVDFTVGGAGGGD